MNAMCSQALPGELRQLDLSISLVVLHLEPKLHHLTSYLLITEWTNSGRKNVRGAFGISQNFSLATNLLCVLIVFMYFNACKHPDLAKVSLWNTETVSQHPLLHN